MALVEPRLLDGFRDLPPDVSILRTAVTRDIRDVFESFGFDPMRTPALERSEIFVGQYGYKHEKHISRLTAGGHDVALRPDLTVALARHIAMNADTLHLPVRRYQAGMIFSASPYGPGRSRESLECDADIVGSRSRLADAECIALAHTLLCRLGIDSAVIHVNNRKIYRGVQNVMGLDEARLNAVQHALNQLTTTDDAEVRKQLADEVKLSAEQVDQLFSLLTLADGTADALLDEAASRFGGSDLATAGIRELRETIDGCRALGVPDDALRVDLFTTRTLDYYTSTVFKTVIPELAGFGSVISGGRYDDLVGIFLGRMVPAVGLGVRVDRLVEALQKLGRRAEYPVTSRAIVLSPDASDPAAALQLTTRLREAGVPCEFTLEPTAPMHQQMRHAQASHVPFGVMPAADGQIALQSLADGRQATVSFDDAVAAIKSWTP